MIIRKNQVFHVKHDRAHKEKIGLAIGGGGVKAFATLGILNVLEKHSVRISCIAGTSMGAIIGGLYAHYKNSDVAYKIIKDFLSMDMSIRLLSKFVENDKNGNMVKIEDIMPVLDRVFSNIKIENLQIAFGSVCTDIVNGEAIVITKGKIKDAVACSIALQGIIEPLYMGNKVLVDGGVMRNTPVDETRTLGADVVIAVEFNEELEKKKVFKDKKEIINRTNRITEIELHRQLIKKADFVISPAVKHIWWADFDKIEYCYSEGVRSAENNIESILKTIS